MTETSEGSTSGLALSLMVPNPEGAATPHG